MAQTHYDKHQEKTEIREDYVFPGAGLSKGWKDYLLWSIFHGEKDKNQIKYIELTSLHFFRFGIKYKWNILAEFDCVRKDEKR